jgi:hypothetical protein
MQSALDFLTALVGSGLRWGTLSQSAHNTPGFVSYSALASILRAVHTFGDSVCMSVLMRELNDST